MGPLKRPHLPIASRPTRHQRIIYSTLQTLATPAPLQVIALTLPVDDGPDAAQRGIVVRALFDSPRVIQPE